MNNLEKTFSWEQSLSLLALMRIIYSSIHSNPKREINISNAIKDFNVSVLALDRFLVGAGPSDVIARNFKTFDSYQKEYADLMIWGMLASADEIKEVEVDIALDTMEKVAGVDPNHFIETVEKWSKMSKEFNEVRGRKPENKIVIQTQKPNQSNNNSESDLKAVLGIIVLALAIFGLVSMCK